jgi:HAD superfamily hydrolase (TIGR01457 family)
MKHGYLLDMDGVVYRGTELVPHAREFIARLRTENTPYLLLTNDSTQTPGQFSHKLKGLGITVPPDHIYSSSQATADWLRNQRVKRVFAIGENGLIEALRQCDIEMADHDVSHVVVGLDRAINYEKLKRASRLIAAGASFVVTNPDPTYPVEDGNAPACGLLQGALEKVTGRLAQVIGKPSAIIYHQAACYLGVPVTHLTMVGDSLDTDIAGALGVGARGVLVMTGHTTRAMLATSNIQPDLVIENLAVLSSCPDEPGASDRNPCDGEQDALLK